MKISSKKIANYADRLTKSGVLVDPAMDDEEFLCIK